MANFVKVEDSNVGYPLDLFCIPRHYEEDLESVLIPYGLISDRIERLARDIVATFSDEDFKPTGEKPVRLTFLCVLKGGYKFFSDLLDRVAQLYRISSGLTPAPVCIEFVRCRSYLDGASLGHVELIGISNLDAIRNQHVLVVEDIVDTGHTMKVLIEELRTLNPRSIHTAVLLVKRDVQTGPDIFRPDFIGFEVPLRYIVGYALDYNERFRDLNHICVLNETGKRKYRSDATPAGSGSH